MKDIAIEFDAAKGSPAEQYEPESGAYTYFGKRLFDLVLAIVALPAILPALALIWLAIRRESGAAMFVQERIGRGGKVFRCYKFCTMVENADRILQELCDNDPVAAAEWDLNQKLSYDPRVTRIGKVLRATSLDELPQIFNVLKGEMSFVGPRPFMVEQQKLYIAAGGNAYFKLRPGITGTWQLEGRGKTSFIARIRYDNDYFTRLSFVSDVRMILRTVAVVFNRTGR